MIRETFSLHGNHSAELQCQKMLWRGVKFLEAQKPPLEMWKQAKSSPQIYGLVITEGDQLKALEKAMTLEGDDCTGAMHHCTLNHIHYIHVNGLDKWAQELRPHRVDDPPMFFDDETETMMESTKEVI